MRLGWVHLHNSASSHLRILILSPSCKVPGLMALSASCFLFQSVFWGPAHGHLWGTWFCLLSTGGPLWESGLYRIHHELGTWCQSSGSCSSVPDSPDSPCLGASALSAQRTAALSHWQETTMHAMHGSGLSTMLWIWPGLPLLQGFCCILRCWVWLGCVRREVLKAQAALLISLK